MALARVLIFVGFGIAACSATDPGVDGLTRASHTQQSGTDSGVQPGKDGGSSGQDGGGSNLDSSAGPDTSTVVDAFTGAGAYTSNMPGTSAVQAHQNNNVNTTPNKSAACLGCHDGNTAKLFLFAGTIYQDKAGTMAASNVEVRVRGNDGNGYIAHSDADGNFWYKPANGDKIVAPAMTGARDSSNKASNMTGTISNTNCNSCHDGNTTDAVHYP